MYCFFRHFLNPWMEVSEHSVNLMTIIMSICYRNKCQFLTIKNNVNLFNIMYSFSRHFLNPLEVLEHSVNLMTIIMSICYRKQCQFLTKNNVNLLNRKQCQFLTINNVNPHV